MASEIRTTNALTAALTTSLATTAAIDISHHAWGTVHIPTGSSITSLTYYTSIAPNGTFVAAQDSTPAAIVQTVGAAKSYPLPSALFGAAAIKIVANAAGNVDISLKS